MKAVRIVLATYGATARDAFSGQSGFVVDGRWHGKGRYLDYAAESLSLATLERLVHYKRFNQLNPHLAYTLNLPDDQVVELPRLPKGWDALEPLPAAQALGNDWCDRQTSPAMKVPSTVTPGEFNLLLNTRHPLWSWKWVSGPQPFSFDERLRDMMAKAKS